MTYPSFFSSLFLLGFLFFANSCAVRMPVTKKSTVSGVSALTSTAPVSATANKIPVWLIADSLHTSMAIPYDWLIESGYRAPKQMNFPQGNQRLVIMSWGDRVAYEQKRWLRPWEVFHALFMPSPSVTEIIPVSWKVEKVCFQQRIYRGEIAAYKGKELAKFLNGSTRFDHQGKPIIIAPSTWGQGHLLDCPYSYYFPRICNVWTGQTLEACGLHINIRSAITADGLIKQVTKQGFVQTSEGIEGLGRTQMKKP